MGMEIFFLNVDFICLRYQKMTKSALIKITSFVDTMLMIEWTSNRNPIQSKGIEI